MNSVNRTLLVAAMPGLLLLPGCSGIGPGTVVPSRFDYSAALGDSWKQQMLVNLVKLRYGEAPAFLDVASVISQFQLTGAVNWGGTFNNQFGSNTSKRPLRRRTAYGRSSSGVFLATIVDCRAHGREPEATPDSRSRTATQARASASRN